MSNGFGPSTNTGGQSGSSGSSYPMAMPVEWNLACGFREIVGRLVNLTATECEVELCNNATTTLVVNIHTVMFGDPDHTKKHYVRITVRAVDGIALSIVRVA